MLKKSVYYKIYIIFNLINILFIIIMYIYFKYKKVLGMNKSNIFLNIRIYIYISNYFLVLRKIKAINYISFPQLKRYYVL